MPSTCGCALVLRHLDRRHDAVVAHLDARTPSRSRSATARSSAASAPRSCGEERRAAASRTRSTQSWSGSTPCSAARGRRTAARSARRRRAFGDVAEVVEHQLLPAHRRERRGTRPRTPSGPNSTSSAPFAPDLAEVPALQAARVPGRRLATRRRRVHVAERPVVVARPGQVG